MRFQKFVDLKKKKRLITMKKITTEEYKGLKKRYIICLLAELFDHKTGKSNLKMVT